MKIFPKLIPPNPYSVPLSFYLYDISKAVGHDDDQLDSIDKTQSFHDTNSNNTFITKGSNNYINFASHLNVFSSKFLKQYFGHLFAEEETELVNEKGIPLVLESRHIKFCSIWNLLQNVLSLVWNKHTNMGNYMRFEIEKIDTHAYFSERPWIEELIQENQQSLGPFTPEQMEYFAGNLEFNDYAYQNRFVSWEGSRYYPVSSHPKYDKDDDPIPGYRLTVGEQLTAKLLIYLAQKSFGKCTFNINTCRSDRVFYYFEFLDNTNIQYKNAYKNPLVKFDDDFYFKCENLVLKEEIVTLVMYHEIRQEQTDLALKFDILRIPKGTKLRYVNYHETYKLVLAYKSSNSDLLSLDIKKGYQDFFFYLPWDRSCL